MLLIEFSKAAANVSLYPIETNKLNGFFKGNSAVPKVLMKRTQCSALEMAEIKIYIR
jgi:hypothetical protein